MNPRWFVVRTESRAEYHAAEALGKDGYEVYLPRLRALSLGTGHPDSPLFPGYIFLRLDPDISGWPSFRWGYRVLGFLHFSNDISSVPDDFITALDERLRTVNGEEGQWQRYQPGDTVRIVTDSIRGLGEVIQDGKTSDSKVRVILEFMGRAVSADVPRENIWPPEYEPIVRTRAPRRTRGKGRPIHLPNQAAPAIA